MKPWIAPKAASTFANIVENEVNTLIPGGREGALASVWCRHHELTRSARGNRRRGQRGARLRKRNYSG